MPFRLPPHGPLNPIQNPNPSLTRRWRPAPPSTGLGLPGARWRRRTCPHAPVYVAERRACEHALCRVGSGTPDAIHSKPALPGYRQTRGRGQGPRGGSHRPLPPRLSRPNTACRARSTCPGLSRARDRQARGELPRESDESIKAQRCASVVHRPRAWNRQDTPLRNKPPVTIYNLLDAGAAAFA